MIISERGNRRMMRWLSQNKTNQQTIISNIDCLCLTMDKNGFMYVSDWKKNEVRRWKERYTNEIIIAGGNGSENELNQLNFPTYIFVNEDSSLYISDSRNNRVMKWRKDAREGIVVARGNGQGKSPTQLNFPQGVIADHLGQIYVAECDNH